MLRVKLLFLITILSCSIISSQNIGAQKTEAYVDEKEVMRWKGSDEEVVLFGVNYTTPFAYSYRAHKKLGLSLKQAIDLDVKHMVQLGLDAFRVHIWDREISDRNGNLLKNEHLDLFDFLLAKLAGNGIKSIITPIAWWATGWPEPDIETPGFSQIYSKVELITNPKAREAQRNYLRQIINHVNPYTKKSYKDDPSIIAIEIINEPKHPNDEQQVTEYVNEMYDVLRKEGLTKPIFYNISENWNEVQANAVGKSKAEGISFQWYPTGLVHNKMLEGNYLINVNKYQIPSKDVIGFDKKAKMIYEFDAADVSGSYMYPAMARSYREAGMQFAAMFSYDPVQIAWSNTEYPTHYVNLLYTPAKAISLMIASKAFHILERNKSYGDYPVNNQFGEFRVDAENDLSEYNSGDCLYYSNSTASIPKNEKSLIHIAGTGNSSVVKYDGNGTYFLDKRDDGIWRLEVYPDAVWLKDPFEQTSMSRQVSKLYWKKRVMKISLHDLGEYFIVHPISDSKRKIYTSSEKGITLTPGIYILSNTSVTKQKLQKHIAQKEKFLEKLYIPSLNNYSIHVIDYTNKYYLSYSKPKFQFTIASEKVINKVFLYIKKLGWRRFEKVPLRFTTGFNYVIADSLKKFTAGNYEYCVAVETDKKIFTFPSGEEENPENWDFATDHLWKIKIINDSDPIPILDPLRDQKDLIFPQWSNSLRYTTDFKNGEDGISSSIALNIEFSEGNKNAFGVQKNISKLISIVKEKHSAYSMVNFKIRFLKETTKNIGIRFLQNDGNSFGLEVSITKEWNEITIPLNQFIKKESLILPNSYPQFLPKKWSAPMQSDSSSMDVSKLEFVQLIIDSDFQNSTSNRVEHGFEVESIVFK